MFCTDASPLLRFAYVEWIGKGFACLFFFFFLSFLLWSSRSRCQLWAFWWHHSCLSQGLINNAISLPSPALTICLLFYFSSLDPLIRQLTWITHCSPRVCPVFFLIEQNEFMTFFRHFLPISLIFTELNNNNNNNDNYRHLREHLLCTRRCAKWSQALYHLTLQCMQEMPLLSLLYWPGTPCSMLSGPLCSSRCSPPASIRFAASAHPAIFGRFTLASR